jgi:DNA-binding CsgD family transcriptional regulator/tetratricopeptide (TPR) repeat protein
MERAASAPMALVDRPERTLCPLAMQPLRTPQELIGRPAEMTAIRQELATAAGGRLACVSIEGEPGIGKTRLMMAAQELAEVDGFGLLALAADEELRGPFMLARSFFGCRQAREIATGTPAAETAVHRAVDALSGRDDPSLAELPPAEKLLRTYDLAASAVAELAAARPLAILLDDLQWADEDSLRLLRYLVRSGADRPILIVITVRPEEMASVGELVNLVADMERQGFMRRLRLHRFTPTETSALLRLALRGEIEPTSAATIHGQAEGVPFIVEELTKAYREAGVIREVDGSWMLSKNAARLVPSAVRTLIGRRAARLPDGTKALLADGGVLGRSFSLQDLRAVREHMDGRTDGGIDMGELLAPAVSAGLLVRYPEGSPADYGFPHEQVREFVVDTLPTSRRRKIHAAIVELLVGGGEPAPESLPMLAYHARAAGDAQASARFAIEASREALGRNAPEEVLRSVELGLPVVSDARDRVALLLLRDDALSMLHRSSDRLQALAEITALADALADPALSLQLMLRRSAALRDSEDWETAGEVAREVRRRAKELGDRSLEQAAALELGQTLLRSPLGEAFVPTFSEVDVDGAEEAYRAALELARSLGDDRGIAAASRELGAVAMARVRASYIDLAMSGDMPRNVFDHAPLATPYMEALGCFQLSLETYSRLGDRHGLMSAILGLAYATMGADFAISGAMRRLEEVRRLSGRLTTLATESERIAAELQLLYGIHVRAREFGDPELAISRGEEAYRLARVHGDQNVEFLAAGGTAMSWLQLGDVDLAKSWLERAADAAVAAPTPLRERRIAMWRGRLAAQLGDGQRMRAHLERAVELATEQGKTAGICESLALLSIEAARLGREASDTELLDLAESAASRTIGMSASLPGHPPWRARANAALTHVRQALPQRGDPLETARAAIDEIVASEQEELFLDIWSACLPPIIGSGDAETVAALTSRLAYSLGGVAEHTLDDDIRRRWFATPPQSELAELVGGSDAVRETFRDSSPYIAGDGLPTGHVDLSSQETELLRLMTEARSDSEIAATLGMTEEQVARQLAEVFGRMNAPSRESATAFALLQRLV